MTSILSNSLLGPRSNIVNIIELETDKSISISDIETISTLSKCHPQDQSPVFTLLPREIRDLIWTFATAPFEDEENKYSTEAFYYRPRPYRPIEDAFRTPTYVP